MTTLVARPTTYNGIKMRSRLEARYAAYLDARGEDWEYEPRAFANKHRQYLPDFLIHLSQLPATDTEPSHVMPELYVEVRPHLDGMRVALEQMAVIWDSDPTAFLLVTSPDLPFEWFATGRGSRKWYVLPCEPWG